MEILIAPLNWGIGHATRCIPLIEQLKVKHQITLAGDGGAADVLKRNFPGFPIFDLPALNIHYSKSKSQVFTMLWQWPKFEQSIQNDKKALDDILGKEHFDLIISDSRYGVYSERIPSVLISHQLHVLATGKLARFQSMADQYFKKKLKPFDRIWVPDIKDEKIGLTGDLSHIDLPERKIDYIGIWSQFNPCSKSEPILNNVLVILSGPEPQRSILEEEILMKFRESRYRLTIVAGNPGNQKPVLSSNMQYIPFAGVKELQQLIEKSEYIIARAGYSTLMDLITLKRKALIIPTPGQTEQEYLAARMQEKKLFYTQKQGSLDIEMAFKKLDELNPDYKPYLINQDIAVRIEDAASLVPNRV
jgi:uncharacterized protein (TIGR00661 family)